MSKTTVAPVQDRLRHEHDATLTELKHLREVIQAEVDLEPDEADEQITEHETAAILVAILEKKLLDIEAALASMESGEYSRCERCGKSIEAERLAAKPDARYCFNCQGIVERIIHQNQLAAMSVQRNAFIEV